MINLLQESTGEHAGRQASPRPSELFDNWAAVGLLIALGVIAVLLLRKRG
jgi:hypothetical protein